MDQTLLCCWVKRRQLHSLESFPWRYCQSTHSTRQRGHSTRGKKRLRRGLYSTKATFREPQCALSRGQRPRCHGHQQESSFCELVPRSAAPGGAHHLQERRRFRVCTRKSALRVCRLRRPCGTAGDQLVPQVSRRSSAGWVWGCSTERCLPSLLGHGIAARRFSAYPPVSLLVPSKEVSDRVQTARQGFVISLKSKPIALFPLFGSILFGVCGVLQRGGGQGQRARTHGAGALPQSEAQRDRSACSQRTAM